MSGQCPDDGLVYPDSLEVLVFAQKLHDTNINMLGTAITKNKCLMGSDGRIKTNDTDLVMVMEQYRGVRHR
jgi:ribosomal protein S13